VSSEASDTWYLLKKILLTELSKTINTILLLKELAFNEPEQELKLLEISNPIDQFPLTHIELLLMATRQY
jgi:hypothetical protein